MKHPELWKNIWICTRRMCLPTLCIQSNNFWPVKILQSLNHPWYFPDLAMCNFFLFPKIYLALNDCQCGRGTGKNSGTPTHPDGKQYTELLWAVEGTYTEMCGFMGSYFEESHQWLYISGKSKNCNISILIFVSDLIINLIFAEKHFSLLNNVIFTLIVLRLWFCKKV